MEFLLHVFYISATLGVGAAGWNYRTQMQSSRDRIDNRLRNIAKEG